MSKTPIGNVVGFSKEMVSNIFYVLGVGYMGGSFSTLGKAMVLFPTDINSPPYTGQIATSTDVDLLEYLWPMKTLGFPYKYMNKMGDGVLHQYVKWMIETCAYVFIYMREMTSETIVVGDRLAKNWIGALFRFYIMPLILIHIMPFSPIVFLLLTVSVSMIFAMEGYGFMYTLAPITAWWYGLTLCNQQLTLKCVVVTLAVWVMGIMSPLIHIPWWFIVTIAVTMYSYIILFFSPFLWSGGLTHTFHEMKSYKMSLLCLFIYLTLKSSNQFLIPSVSMGLIIGAIYVIFRLFGK
jgi:hypothetical protein